jgi:hypothetical protein
MRCGFGLGECGRIGFDRIVEEVEEMPLAGIIAEAFAARAEDIAAQQCQCLGEFGVFLLQEAVVVGGLGEHAFEFINAASVGVGLLLSVVGLLPQLVVAAEQVVEPTLAFTQVVRERLVDAHDMNYTRYFM